jgi:hypothetical protein
MFIVAAAIQTIVNWVVLMIVIPVAQRLGDFDLPNLPDRWWRILIMAAALTATHVLVHQTELGLIIGSILAFIVLWAFMYIYFDADAFGTVMVVVVLQVVDFIVQMSLITWLYRTQPT